MGIFDLRIDMIVVRIVIKLNSISRDTIEGLRRKTKLGRNVVRNNRRREFPTLRIGYSRTI